MACICTGKDGNGAPAYAAVICLALFDCGRFLSDYSLQNDDILSLSHRGFLLSFVKSLTSYTLFTIFQSFRSFTMPFSSLFLRSRPMAAAVLSLLVVPSLVAAQASTRDVAPYTYAGCFDELDGLRLLPDNHTVSDQMTIEQCVSDCQGSVYIGLEYAGECMRYSVQVMRKFTDANRLVRGHPLHHPNPSGKWRVGLFVAVPWR